MSHSAGTFTSDPISDLPWADSVGYKKYHTVWIIKIIAVLIFTVSLVNTILLSPSGDEITDFSK